MVDVLGAVADGFEPVREAFVRNFEERGELGAAVTLYRDGRKVVDLWAGAADADGDGTGAGSGAAWAEDTAQVVRSATKGVASACLLLLHQRGQLDLDAPVGTYWPEFKTAGKERVTVRDALAHRAGVPALDTPLTPAQAMDGVSGPRALAAQAPFWVPGGDHGYHAMTYSWLIGELVLRASGGRSVGRYVAEEIARPLGLDLWVGLPAGQEARVGRIAAIRAPEAPPAAGLRARPKRSVTEAYDNPRSLTRQAFGAIDPLPDENDPAYRAAELAASAGIATARSLARFYAALVGGLEDGGPRLFAPATLTSARTAESEGPDRVLVVNTRFGLGYMLHGPSSPFLSPGSFGHPGRGGSLGFADPDAGIGFGYVTNGMQKNVTADPRAQALVRAVRECLR
ncbi:serine hydrolase domain-containing protein [Streptomyces sp. NPDC088354]|uniref:serine hydrolase domain-containing protein n=1 Tax=unclassified Streptomyces TaxID=2593676 RepID=UPI0029A2CD71|nr:serine hydrolase domain-containing protein [Streptomyces sp. MI02-7b]MDX3074903.1 serine hydrolase [Streptomyces sp. MI02-7b]